MFGHVRGGAVGWIVAGSTGSLCCSNRAGHWIVVETRRRASNSTLPTMQFFLLPHARIIQPPTGTVLIADSQRVQLHAGAACMPKMSMMLLRGQMEERRHLGSTHLSLGPICMYPAHLQIGVDGDMNLFVLAQNYKKGQL
eukprot:scaffold421230_cov61-Attheya_sp.AAC.1